jgi:ubiquitin C-terminal hydrolase
LKNSYKHPRIDQNEGGNTGWMKNSSGTTVSLRDCFSQYRNVENLGSDDLWYCSKCKDHVEATKQLDLYTIPPVLIIDVKRFKNQGIQYSDKVSDFVKVPTQGFDMGEFVLNKKGSEHLIYDLFGVVNHYGSLNYGHYKAIALCEN